jgi:hypothetical protein
MQRTRISPGVLQPASLKTGTCPGYHNSGEGRPTSDYDWLDWASWEAAYSVSSN